MVPEINHVAVVIAAFANFLIGWVWYGPLFGQAWAKMAGVDLSQKPPGSKIAQSMIFMLISSLLMAYVLDHALIFGNAYLGTSGLGAGAQGAFYYWIGFIVPVTLGVVLWENKPWKLWFLNAGYYLVSLCVMGTILMYFM